jgi:hypothetical protein
MCEAAAAAHRDAKIARKPKQTNRYDRNTALANFGCFYSQDLIDTSPKGRAKILRMMGHALKREVKARDEGHWSYDQNRHAIMLDAFKRERMAFEAITDTRWGVAA